MFGNIYQLLIFLIDTVFDLFLYLLVIRFIIASAGGTTNEQISMIVSRATSFITTPVRKIIPDYKGIEIGTLVVIFVVAIIKAFLHIVIPFGIPSVVNLILGMILMAIGYTFFIFCQVLFYAILLFAILSWVQPGLAINRLLARITVPLLRPFQKVVPPMGGIDFSPIIPLVLIQLILIMAVSNLIAKGQAIALG
jgi:YggT family protein